MLKKTSFLRIAVLFLFFALTLNGARSNNVEIGLDGTTQQGNHPQSKSATFVNHCERIECGLYWSGNEDEESREGTGLRLFYGPLEPVGGSRTVEGFLGQVFVLVEAGTYKRLAEYTLGNDDKQHFVLTDTDVEARQKEQLPSASSAKLQEKAKECRSAANNKNCQECMEQSGCGWSVVRKACFLWHPIATTRSKEECTPNLPDPETKSVDAWLNQANTLLLSSDNDSLLLRQAYQVVEYAAERAKASDALSQKKVRVALAELSAKLQAVFDDQDAKELLASSRHEALAKIHPQMPMVDRRTMAEAKSYILQGHPVVITNAFADITGPVAHKWTLEYLYRKIFSSGDTKSSFNVAADYRGRCCRYFESQQKSKTEGYPYPFAPTTHLYRDTFDGFVKTVRKAARSNTPPKLLHYLHEIVMNAQGEVVVAGGPAPRELVTDIEVMTSSLQQIASDESFFGGFASAKVWIGQRGIVMPMHYDATDNLYVMAWGRKRAIIGPPGQLDMLYRFPNTGHPLVGSSQVNISSPNLEQFPRFQEARLQEVIVGPGDILYLPAWWWHQFEQPFEDTAALNLWSRDFDNAPSADMRDYRVREHALYDQLERVLVQQFGNQTGSVLQSLANDNVEQPQLQRAKQALNAAAEQWRQDVRLMPGGHPKTSMAASQLVAEYLTSQLQVMNEESGRSTEWKPGTGWDFSQIAVLPRDLRERCTQVESLGPFRSHCN